MHSFPHTFTCVSNPLHILRLTSKLPKWGAVAAATAEKPADTHILGGICGFIHALDGTRGGGEGEDSFDPKLETKHMNVKQ